MTVLTDAPARVENMTWTHEMRARVAELWNQGATYVQIAAVFDTTPTRVIGAVAYMRTLGWTLAEHQVGRDPAQRGRALANGNKRRTETALLTRRLKTGEVSPREVLVAPEPPVAGWCAVELARRCPGIGTWRLELLGRDAIRHGVNIAMPLGRMNGAHRDWLGQWLEAARRATSGLIVVDPPDWTTARREAA